MDDENIFECIKIINETNMDFKIKNQKDVCVDMEIRKLLKDEALFFKITKNRACQLLEALDIKKEQIDITYEKLISKKEFYNLLHKGKINLNDISLLIRYPTYDTI